MSAISDELALRCGLDPAWDCVMAAYLAGLADYPQPFQPRVVGNVTAKVNGTMYRTTDAAATPQPA